MSTALRLLPPLALLAACGPTLSPECRVDTESTERKITEQLAADFAAGKVPARVIVKMKEDLGFQPLPTCPDHASTCRELETRWKQYEELAAGSQRCAQEHVRSLGTEVTEVFVLSNSFAAGLDAAGVEVIAARVDVAQVSGDSLLPP